MKNPKFGDYVPIALLMVGFGLIGLAWNGAASWDCAECQIPYMISGGLTGLGLIFFGAVALIARAIKTGQTQQAKALEQLNDSVARLGASLSWVATSNGDGGGTHERAELVVAGASSFHLADCRLVDGRDTAVQIPRTEAVDAGLEACRICEP